MSVNQEFEKTGSIAYLCDEYLKNNFIDPEASERLGVKRGLRNPDGTGVLAGLTNVCDVVGYDLVEGKRVPTDGKLIYRGIDVEQIVRAAYAEDRFVFEEVIWLLLFGSLPTPHQLASFKQVLEAHRELPKDFAEDMIMKAPSPNIMNKMARSVLALYSYDDNPEEQSLTNILSQSIALIASLPIPGGPEVHQGRSKAAGSLPCAACRPRRRQQLDLCLPCAVQFRYGYLFGHLGGHRRCGQARHLGQGRQLH